MTMRDNGQINIVLNGQVKKMKVTTTKEVVNMKHEVLQAIEEEMDSLVGLKAMKQTMREIYASVHMYRKREEYGLKTQKQALHMMFKGNPGTGKTTVARLIGKMFQKMNVLSKGHLVEAERADLVGEYIGHTAQKTRELIKKAMGGVLFVDEAYSLARGGEKDFGKEAIDVLVRHMENHQHEFILILAGYSREMEYFLSLNPGLESRFPFVVDFLDYGVEELMEIANMQLWEREYRLSQEAETKLLEHLHGVKEKLERKPFSNGRYVRNIIEQAIRHQAMRLLSYTTLDRYELMMIRGEDLEFKLKE